MLTIIALLILGFPIGLFSGLLGIGGGVFIVPTFYALFPTFSAHAVIATSLASILVNNLITNYHFYKQGRVPKKEILMPMLIAIAIGSLIGQKVAFLFDALTLKKIFALTLLALMLQMILTRKSHGREENPPRLNNKEKIYAPLSALIAGFFGGITGLGGGVIMIPVLNVLCKMRMNWVVVYSNLAIGVGTLTALFGFGLAPLSNPLPGHPIIAQYQLGHINLAMVLLVIPGAYFASRWGVKLSHNLPQKTIKLIFAALLLLMSLKIFFN